MRKSGELATVVADVKPTQGELCVPSPPVSLTMGQPSVMAWLHFGRGDRVDADTLGRRRVHARGVERERRAT